MNQKSKHAQRRYAFSMISCVVLLVVSGICSIATKAPFFLSPLAAGIAFLVPFCLDQYRRVSDKKAQKAGYAERQKKWLSLRENREKESRRLLRKLICIHAAEDLYGILLLACAAIIAMFPIVNTKMIYLDIAILFAYMLLSGLLFGAAFSQLILMTGRRKPERPELKVKKEGCPLLYALAEKAARECGFHGNISIGIVRNNNVNISRVKGGVILNIDLIILSILTENELYSILLHEFTHMHERAYFREGFYAGRISAVREDSIFDGFDKLLFIPLDSLYLRTFSSWRYASDLDMEFAADDGAKTAGVEDFAFALMKIFFLDAYYFEKSEEDGPNFYAKETLTDFGGCFQTLADIKTAFTERAPFWRELIDREIVSRTTTHPTTKQRLEHLGADVPQGGFSYPDGAHGEEVESLLKSYDGIIFRNLAANNTYARLRRDNYTVHAERIAAWEQEGEPVTADNYSDIMDSLNKLGQKKRTAEFCSRVIDMLPETRTASAYLRRGVWRLSHYDDGGIEDLYETIRQEPRFSGLALDIIGGYCCRMGLREELDSYREKAALLAENYGTGLAVAGVFNRKMIRRLTANDLPEELVQSILNCVAADKEIEDIYLVRQKLTENLCCHILIIHFDLFSPDQIQKEILHKLNKYVLTIQNRMFFVRDASDLEPWMTMRIEKIRGAKIR